MKACNAKAIYFEKSVRRVDYAKCKSCLNCVQVCPRNAIEVSSVIPLQVLTVKIDHDKCNMCLLCVDENGGFCPKNLFYVDQVRKEGQEIERIRFNYKEIVNCQGCLKCKVSCPTEAIKPIQYEV
jgi:ferredoxin